MRLCLIVILTNVVHKQNVIVKNSFIRIHRTSKNTFHLGVPEWMDDNNDDENQLSHATFEHDGTFMGSSVLRQNSNEQPKFQSQSSTDETVSRGNIVSDRSSSKNLNWNFHRKTSSKQQEGNKFERSTPSSSSQASSAAVDIPKASKTIGNAFFFLLLLNQLSLIFNCKSQYLNQHHLYNKPCQHGMMNSDRVMSQPRSLKQPLLKYFHSPLKDLFF